MSWSARSGEFDTLGPVADALRDLAPEGVTLTLDVDPYQMM